MRQPRASSASEPANLAQAQRALLEADLERSLELCEAAVPADAGEQSQLTLVRCRALIRLERHAAALELLDAKVSEMHGDALLMAHVLRGIALVRQGASERGLAALHAVRAGAASASVTVRSELSLAIALAHYWRQEFDSVEKALDDVGAGDGSYYARAVMFRGFIAVQRNDYRGAVEIFKRALELHERSGAIDVVLQLNVVRALCYISAEVLDWRLWSYVEEYAGRHKLFGDGVGASRYGLHYARAIQYETLGRPSEALLAARESALAAPTEQLRLAALCKRATVLFRYGERLAYGDLAISVRESFRALEPESIRTWDDTAVPLMVAEVCAIVGDVNGAIAAADIGARSADGPLSADDWPAPLAAFRSYVEGVVAEAKGESLHAKHCYHNAFQRYAELGFARKAMIVAFQIANVGSDASTLQYLEEHSRSLPPESWIVRRCAALGVCQHDPWLAQLSRSDRETLALLFEGRSTAEIAVLRNRSPQTVRNTISRLNQMFGVGDRHALVRECTRRKLFEPN